MRFTLLIAIAFVGSPSVAQAPATSPQAAVRLVQRYYAAINRGDFRSAYLTWDRNGAASGRTYYAFRAGFAQTARTRVVTHGTTNAEAGMSQRTIDVPVDVYATLKNGRHQHFRGSYTLHRVVQGVGAPAAQLNWHIASAKLLVARP